ncbi:MAG: hypothetical protein Q4F71_01465 [Paracoccus sp. (in: a-proteobacteria)]|nr:hypothetical protein [Paracoccus sp. (in: a-proteobacteria)]
MERKPEIPEPTRSEIEALISASREAFDAGDLQKSHQIGLQAWDLIPEPKAQWDYYPQSLSKTFVEDSAELGDAESTHKWVEIMAEMYDDPNHEDHYVLTAEAEAMEMLGDRERFHYVVGRILELYGEAGFEGEQREWLESYRADEASRNE